MKIYFTTDGSFDDNLEQVCPFAEYHHFKREDGSEYTMPKYVGCGGCANCPFCYGKGIERAYGSNPKDWMLIPIAPRNVNDDWDGERTERIKLQLGMRQFRTVSSQDYVKCAKCYSEEFRKKSKTLKFKIWWWHHIGIKINYLLYKLDKFYCDYFLFKIKDFYKKHLRIS